MVYVDEVQPIIRSGIRSSKSSAISSLLTACTGGELGRLLATKYKRFLADVSVGDSMDPLTVYCPNTGAMLGLIPPSVHNPECMLSTSTDLTRKYAHTIEMIASNGVWVGIHSALANKMVKNALEMGLIKECAGFTTLKTEVKIDEGRIDFELVFETARNTALEPPTPDVGAVTKKRRRSGSARPCPIESRMLVEVKSVTLAYPGGGEDASECIAEFPDTVSTRAAKHAHALRAHVLAGGRAAILFLIQRGDVTSFTTSPLDPTYQRAVHDAAAAGVLILPYKCYLCPQSGQVLLLGRVPFLTPSVE